MSCNHREGFKCATCAPRIFNGEGGRERTIAWLARQVGAARLAYEAGTPFMRDEEFDSLEKSLRAYDPNNPVLRKVGTGQGEPDV
jgi:hypothetical protein